jgi:nitroreductase
MDLTQAIQNRYSCRSYLNKAIEQEKLNLLIEAARLAPSARNLQDWRFVIVTDSEKRAALQNAAANQAFVGQAPVVIAACSNTQRRMVMCGQPYSSINVSIALEHIALTATSLGLATCWIGSFIPHKVRKILGIPSAIEVVQLMTVGYPADTQPSPKRVTADHIICYEKWNFH